MGKWECGGVSLHSHSFSPLPGGLPPPPGLPTSAVPLKTAPEFRNRGRYAACDNLSEKRTYTGVAQWRAPVSKTGGWGNRAFHPCQGASPYRISWRKASEKSRKTHSSPAKGDMPPRSCARRGRLQQTKGGECDGKETGERKAAAQHRREI